MTSSTQIYICKQGSLQGSLKEPLLPFLHGRVRNVSASLTAVGGSRCVFPAVRQTMTVHPGGTESRNKLIACTQDFFGDVPVAVCSGHYLAHGLLRAWQIAWPEQQFSQESTWTSERTPRACLLCKHLSWARSQERGHHRPKRNQFIRGRWSGKDQSSILGVLEKPRKMSVKLLKD